MYILATVLIIIASIVMILIVLVQNSKGGGLSSSFGGGGGGQMGGVVQQNKFMEKTTWVLAVALLVLSITASMSIPRAEKDKESATKKYQSELNTTSIPQPMSPEQVEKLNKETKKEE